MIPRPVDLPDFIIFGAAKSGTSAYHKALGQHPEIFLSGSKEPNYFSYPERLFMVDRKRQAYDTPDLQQYQSLFKSASPTQLRGEASVHYHQHSDAPRRIHRLLPDVKLIAILRHPVDRAYSGWLHAHHLMDEPETDFLSACRKLHSFDGKNWGNKYLSGSFYAAQLKTWFDLFPAPQIKIFLYDDWKHAPATVLRETFTFLGVDPDHSITVEQRNVSSLKPRSKKINDLLNPGPQLRAFVRKTIPDSIRPLIIRQLTRCNRGRPAAPLDPEVRALLTLHFEQDIKELETLLDRDLSAWLPDR